MYGFSVVITVAVVVEWDGDELVHRAKAKDGRPASDSDGPLVLAVITFNRDVFIALYSQQAKQTA